MFTAVLLSACGLLLPPLSGLPPLRLQRQVRCGAVAMEEDGGGGGALAAMGTTFEQALGSLPADEKYNAVLISLLTKGDKGSASALELVAEMSAKRLVLSSEALKALLNSAVGEGAPATILSSLTAGRANGACRAFATPQLRLADKPDSGALAALPELPTDTRGTEVGVASAFAVAVGGVFAAEVVDFIDFSDGLLNAPPIQLVLLVLALGWGFDRYARQGELAALLGRGLGRLFARDLQRECAIESASFLTGYLLGLPCCPFAPTVFKPLDMLAESGGGMEADIGAPARLIDRTLIWVRSRMPHAVH